MRKSLVSAFVIISAIAVMGDNCSGPQTQVKETQSQKAQAAANSIRFTENAEIDNIKHRLELTSDPGKLGFVLLLNEMGQPVLYEGVKGKITSSGKRLTRPDTAEGYVEHQYVRAAASDEGTYGHSDDYVYYWNMDGVYRQWNGKYLYADQPIRLRIEPLVINVKP